MYSAAVNLSVVSPYLFVVLAGRRRWHVGQPLSGCFRCRDVFIPTFPDPSVCSLVGMFPSRLSIPTNFTGIPVAPPDRFAVRGAKLVILRHNGVGLGVFFRFFGEKVWRWRFFGYLCIRNAKMGCGSAVRGERFPPPCVALALGRLCHAFESASRRESPVCTLYIHIIWDF